MPARPVITFSSSSDEEEEGDAASNDDVLLDDEGTATTVDVVPNERRPANVNASAPAASSRQSRGNHRRRESGWTTSDAAAVTPGEVIRRIDMIVMQCIQALDDGCVPILRGVVDTAKDGDSDDDSDDSDNEEPEVLDARDDESDAPGASMSDNEEDMEDDDNPNSQHRSRRRSRKVGSTARTATQMTTTTTTRTRTAGRNASEGPVVKRMTLRQCRSYTSLVLVLSYCHHLLLSRRTTTLREVYYAFVTHFKNQAECNASVQQAAKLLGVPRHALGLKASPRGWFCGDVQFVHWTTGDVVLDGRASNSQGHAVTSEWLEGSRDGNDGDVMEEVEGDANEQRKRRPYRLRTCRATCVLVVEKEGVYQRLVEDELHVRHPCILVSSRGFPDFATRAFVSALQSELDLPVYGLCDCNPYGVSVLNTFVGGNSGGSDSTFIQWMGLRPSQVDAIRNELPSAVFQAMTPGDVNRLQSIRNDDESASSSSWLHSSLLSPYEREQRRKELDQMLERGYKVELEALHWLGMEYLTNWVGKMLVRQHGTTAATSPGALQNGVNHDETQLESDEEATVVHNEKSGDTRLLDVI